MGVWCGQVCTQVTQEVWASGRSMRDLIHVVPFRSFVVAIIYSIPLSSIWERKRRAAISAYDTPPRKNTSVVRFSPCWPAEVNKMHVTHYENITANENLSVTKDISVCFSPWQYLFFFFIPSWHLPEYIVCYGFLQFYNKIHLLHFCHRSL